jgi:hypothetical protein
VCARRQATSVSRQPSIATNTTAPARAPCRSRHRRAPVRPGAASCAATRRTPAGPVSLCCTAMRPVPRWPCAPSLLRLLPDWVGARVPVGFSSGVHIGCRCGERCSGAATSSSGARRACAGDPSAAPFALPMDVTLATLVDEAVDEDQLRAPAKIEPKEQEKKEPPDKLGVPLSQPDARPKGFEPLTF